MICGHGHEEKFKYPYPRDSKIIQMPYPGAKAVDQNPALCPASPPRRLDIDRCITCFYNVTHDGEITFTNILHIPKYLATVLRGLQPG